MFFRSLAHAVLLLALCLALVGCIKFKQRVILNPDGSGKMELVVAMSEQTLAMAGADNDPFADFSVEEMMDEEENGFVAFSEPVIEMVEGYKTMTVTGYFEDINELSFVTQDEGDDAELADPTTYTFDADGTLTIHRPMLGQMASDMGEEDVDLSDPQMRAMMAPVLAGMEITEGVVLPGAVTASGYLVSEDNEASFTITADLLLGDDTEAIDQLEATEEITIQFDPAGWESGEKSAWKAELKGAKAQWEALKEAAAVAVP